MNRKETTEEGTQTFRPLIIPRLTTKDSTLGEETTQEKVEE